MNPLFDMLLAPRLQSDDLLLETETGRHLTYGDMLALSGRLASALAAMGVTPGDRVAAQVEKSPEAIAVYLATIRMGAVFLPLNSAYTANEIGYFLGDAEPAVLVADPAAASTLQPLAERHGARFETMEADGGGSLLDAALASAPDSPVAERGKDDLAAILYTSGTTGRSKGAMLTQNNLLSNALALTEAWRFTARDTLLHALPIFHTHGLFVAINVVLAAGASLLFLPRFDADEVMRLLPRTTTMMGVPTFYARLLARTDFTREAVSHMRLFTSGSAPLLAETHAAFENRTGHRILERYGMTETGMSTSNPYEGARKAGTVGPPLAGVEAKVTDPKTGVEVEKGEIGVLRVRGPNVFRGYWRMPEKTAEELGADGWFLTGDLSRVDEDGYVVIVGRDKDLIITGGFNVYPKEVETLIDALPGVLESAVIGVPHPDFGEGVVAVVAPSPGTELGEAKVRDGLAADLAKFKQPKKVFFVDELPRNSMGKVQKNLLRGAYAKAFSG